LTEVEHMAVRYDRRGSFAGVSFHDSVGEALDAAREAGCRFLSVGEHPRSVRPRHFALDGAGWRELESGEDLDRLRGLGDPGLLFWSAA
jgi:hypothetical protein